jgi:hypothetical protein
MTMFLGTPNRADGLVIDHESPLLAAQVNDQLIPGTGQFEVRRSPPS